MLGDNTLGPVDDQRRGVGRPTDGNGNGVAICDIGAYEASGSVPSGRTCSSLQRALFNLSKGPKTTEQFTERQARFTVPAGQSIDPFGRAVPPAGLGSGLRRSPVGKSSCRPGRSGRFGTAPRPRRPSRCTIS